nr:hypothetical protein Iba_chr15aCG15570 [Ipomoea batatas]
MSVISNCKANHSYINYDSGILQDLFFIRSPAIFSIVPEFRCVSKVSNLKYDSRNTFSSSPWIKLSVALMTLPNGNGNSTSPHLYLVPVLFDFNSSTFRKAYATSKPLRDNVKVKLLVVWDKGLNNESCDGTFASTHLNLITSLPSLSFTNTATSARSSFKATRPLFPRLPKSISGLTTNFVEESQGSLSTSSLRSVDSVT